MDMEGKNYYDRLGVQRTATLEEIKEAYYEIARVYHPDSRFFDDLLEESELVMTDEQLKVFRMVTEAYNTLIRDEKRKAYDRTLPAELNPWSEPKASRELFTDDLKTDLQPRIKRPRKDTKTYGRFGLMNELNQMIQESEPGPRLRSVSQIIREEQQRQMVKGPGYRKMALVAASALMFAVSVVVVLVTL